MRYISPDYDLKSVQWVIGIKEIGDGYHNASSSDFEAYTHFNLGLMEASLKRGNFPKKSLGSRTVRG